MDLHAYCLPRKARRTGESPGGDYLDSFASLVRLELSLILRRIDDKTMTAVSTSLAFDANSGEFVVPLARPAASQRQKYRELGNLRLENPRRCGLY
jgi:hypothetical protein